MIVTRFGVARQPNLRAQVPILRERRLRQARRERDDADERACDERAREWMPESTHDEHATYTIDLFWTLCRHGLLHSSEYLDETSRAAGAAHCRTVFVSWSFSFIRED